MKKQLFGATIFVFLIINFSYAYNPEHLGILLNRSIPDNWARWRKKNFSIKPDLGDALIEGVIFFGDFSYVNLQKARITRSKITEAKFFHTDLSYSNITKVDAFMVYGSAPSLICKNSFFYKTEISDSKFFGSQFYNSNFSEVKIRNTNFSVSIYSNLNFVKAEIINSKLDYIFNDIDFSFVRIVNSTITSGFTPNSRLFNIKFDHAKILNSSLGSQLYNVSFRNADLSGTSFYFIEFKFASILTNVNFTNANLTNVNFQKAKFHNVIFKNADMTGAKLERKWYEYVKKQGVRNFDKIQWM